MLVTEELMRKFEKQYNCVIDQYGNPKLVGRMATSDLIDICYKIDPNGNFGNTYNGMMNVESINMLAKRLGIV